MAGLLVKGLIGKEDMSIQINTNANETFSRVASTGTLSLHKFPDIWDGTGEINIASLKLENNVGELVSHGPNPQSYTSFHFETTFPETLYCFGAAFDGYVGTKTPWEAYVALNDKATMYVSMYRNASRPDAVWAANFITHVVTGADVYAAQGVEIDVNNMEADVALNATAILDGLDINSGGTFQPWRAIGIGATLAGNKWRKGIHILDASFSDIGIQIGTMAPITLTNADILARQVTNGWDTILLQINTDTLPTGSLIRAVNAANTVNLVNIDVSGNAGFAGYLALTAGPITIAGVQVVGTRKTGWSNPTGTATRTAFETSTVSTELLAQRVKGLIDDLITHGLIGT